MEIPFDRDFIADIERDNRKEVDYGNAAQVVEEFYLRRYHLISRAVENGRKLLELIHPTDNPQALRARATIYPETVTGDRLPIFTSLFSGRQHPIDMSLRYQVTRAFNTTLSYPFERELCFHWREQNEDNYSNLEMSYIPEIRAQVSRSSSEDQGYNQSDFALVLYMARLVNFFADEVKDRHPVIVGQDKGDWSVDFEPKTAGAPMKPYSWLLT